MEEKKYELYKWYPIVDEGEYWTNYDFTIPDEINNENSPKIKTLVTNGETLWTYRECNLGWGTMAKSGDWKFMRIKID